MFEQQTKKYTIWQSAVSSQQRSTAVTHRPAAKPTTAAATGKVRATVCLQEIAILVSWKPYVCVWTTTIELFLKVSFSEVKNTYVHAVDEQLQGQEAAFLRHRKLLWEIHSV